MVECRWMGSSMIKPGTVLSCTVQLIIDECTPVWLRKTNWGMGGLIVGDSGTAVLSGGKCGQLQLDKYV